jgi:uncharacterized protein YndB with AHSA1/START domain
MKETAKISLFIHASSDQVWQGLTDPVIVKQYFFGTNVVSTWQLGAPIYFRGEWEGKSYEDKGLILSIDPGKHLTYSYWSSMSGTPDLPENYRNVTYQLTTENGGTKLEVLQESDADKKEHSESNWKMIFGGLKKILEQKPS